MADVTIVQGDRNPRLQLTLLDVNGDPVDVSTSTVKFWMAKGATFAAKIVGAAMVVEDGPAGEVGYDWTADDVDEAGSFRGEVEVIDVAGKSQRFPTAAPLSIYVRARLVETP